MYSISNSRSSQNHNPHKLVTLLLPNGHADVLTMRVDFRTLINREWKISHFKPAFEPKVGDYPLSF